MEHSEVPAVTALKDNEDIVEPLAERILGRVSVHDIFDPITDELILNSGDEITEEIARRIRIHPLKKWKYVPFLPVKRSEEDVQNVMVRNLSTGKNG